MHDLIRRSGALLLLVGFLFQAADGLAATACQVDMAGAEAHGHTGHAPGSGSEDGIPDRDDTRPDPDPPHPLQIHVDPGSADHPCPFGAGAMASCGGVGSLPAPAPWARGPDSAPIDLVSSAPGDRRGALLAFETFRPPRA